MTRLIVFLLALCLAGIADAAGPCPSIDDAIATIAKKYGEVPAFVGHVGETTEQTLVVTISPEGSWTVWIQPNAQAMCMVASGRGWAATPVPIPPTVPQPQKGKAGVWLLPTRDMT